MGTSVWAPHHPLFMLVGMKFNELDEDDQKKVRDALRNSPESKKRDEALRTVEKETYALLRELREEPMTVGALFVVFTAAAAFANDAISRDSAKWGITVSPCGTC